MIMPVFRRALPLALAALLGACVQTGGPVGNLARTVVPQGKFIVCVLDVSESMDTNDPKHYNETGAHLAIALAGAVDNFGAVSFSSRASVLAPLRTLADKAGRRSFHDEVGRAPRRGQTNYVAALRTAYDMLAAGNAPAGAGVIFLTDGEHNVGGTEADVVAAAARFAERDWRVHVVGLRMVGDSKLLDTVARTAKGTHFRVANGEELLNAYLTILGQLHNFMFFDGNPEPIHLMPGSDRLVYVVLKKSADATVRTLTRDGLGVDPKARNVYKHPEQIDFGSDLEIVSVEDPPPGVWDIALQGDCRVGAILQRPPFMVRLDESLLQADYHEGEPIRIALVVDGGGGDVLKYVREAGSATATVRSQTNLQDVATATLKRDPSGSGLIRFEGEIAARPSKPGAPELQTLIARFILPEKGGGQWRREVRFSVYVKPGPREHTVRVTPGEIDLGGRWADGGPASAELSVSGSGQDVVLRPGSPALRITPDRITAAASGGKAVVTIDPAALPAGRFQSAVEVTLPRPGGGETERIRIPVRLQVARLESAAGLDAGQMAPGERWELPLKLGPDVKAAPGALDGPGKLDAVLEGGKLAGTIPVAAKEGEYAGKVALSLAGFPPREIPLKLRVKARNPRFSVSPASISLETDEPKTLAVDLKIDLQHPRPVAFEAKFPDLKAPEGVIQAAYLGLVPEEADWDGRTIPENKTVRARFIVKVKPDHKAGVHEGRLVFTAKHPEDGETGVEIPVKVDAKLK
jgi:hypothetical protein